MSKVSNKPIRKNDRGLKYKRRIILIAEGSVTEPAYFRHIGTLVRSELLVEILGTTKGSSATDPASLLKRMKQFLKKSSIQDRDEAWIICDRDNWPQEQLEEIYKWSQYPNRGMALTNPKFEYWLLLHIEEGTGLKSSQDCDQRLNKYLPGYNKRLDLAKFPKSAISQAIDRAEKRPKTENSWPKNLGETQVHLLVKKLLDG